MGNENSPVINRMPKEKSTMSLVSSGTASFIEQNEEIPVSMLVEKIELDSQIEASKNIFHRDNPNSLIFNSETNLPKSMPLPSLTSCCSGLMASRDFGKSDIFSDFQPNYKHDGSLCSSETINLTEDCPIMRMPNESVFDFYRIIEKMEEGREVYKVKEIATGEFRALKIVSKVSFKDKHLIKGEAEYESLTKLNHPNIIKLFSVFQDFNKYYLILQYLKHQSLLEYLSKHTIDQGVNRYIIMQILITLKYMHAHGVVHRDLRLQNILISHNDPSERPSIKIINFGLSLNLHKDCLKRHVYGSIFYASPESFQGIINEKYDIWSVGIITLILFTEITPSSFESEQYLTNIVRKGKVYRENLKHIPDRVKHFVVQMLIFKNKKRPAAQQALKMEWISGQEGLYKRRRRKISNIDEELLYRY